MLAKHLLDAFDQATQVQQPIPAMVRDLPNSLYEFVQKVPIQVDKHPLDFERHPYLIPIYKAVNFDKTLHPHSFNFVLMTGAQVGKSVTIMLALIFASAKFWAEKFGYFLPDREMADIFSSDRFAPMVQSNPSLSALNAFAQKIKGLKAEDRKRVRTLGATTIFFSYMGGKTSTEAIPMAGIFFDEVRRMLMRDVERAEERTSHAYYPLNFKISTAGYPDTTIDAYFKKSTMNKWHSRCGCANGVILSEHWPNCVGESNGEVFFRCPRCDRRIDRPQDGWFVPDQPESRTIGFAVPQIISPAMNAKRIWDKWLTATDRQEFYNSTLGLPWVDPDSIIVTEAIAKACVNESLHWMTSATNSVMGIDQRGGNNHVVIGGAGPEGKFQIRHLAILQGDDPFAGLGELMQRFDVDVCVCDALPSYNESTRFAKQFRRRVFLAYYSDNTHMLRWSDQDGELKALQKAKPDAKHEFHVFLDRYKSLEFMLMQWVLRRIEVPHPQGLVQEVTSKGLKRVSYICLGNADTGEEGLFYHLRSLAKRNVKVMRRDSEAGKDIETGEFRPIFENIGIDPHFAHALNYAMAAFQRRKTTNELWFTTGAGDLPKSVPEVQKAAPERDVHQAAVQAQFNQRVIPTVQVLPDTCGACDNFQRERTFCSVRQFVTHANTPVGSCMEFIEKRDE